MGHRFGKAPDGYQSRRSEYGALLVSTRGAPTTPSTPAGLCQPAVEALGSTQPGLDSSFPLCQYPVADFGRLWTERRPTGQSLGRASSGPPGD